MKGKEEGLLASKNRIEKKLVQRSPTSAPHIHSKEAGGFSIPKIQPGIFLGKGWYFLFVCLFVMIYLFIFGCVGSSLLYAGFLVAASGGYSLLRCMGFSLQWLLLLQSTGFSRCGTWAQLLRRVGSVVTVRRLSSCGAQASLLHGMWDLPGPGLEPGSPALAGGFLSTAPPGKS